MIRAAIQRPATLWRRTLSNRAFITYYTKEHEYLKVDGNVGTLGITQYAAEELGDIVFVGLPEVDDTFEIEDSVATVESVKSTSDIYAPIEGKVLEVNSELEDNPGMVNESPEENGWFVKVEISNSDQLKDLMSKEQYDEHLDSLKDE